MATELEGHPDNAAAALLGGVTVSCQREDGAVIARSSRWPEAVKLVVATPDTGLHTSHARQVLPTELPLTDAIFNLQRALLLVHALRSGRYDDLREAMKDRWHQSARTALVPGLAEAIAFDDRANTAPRDDRPDRTSCNVVRPGSRDTTRVLERDSRAIDPRSGLAVCVRQDPPCPSTTSWTLVEFAASRYASLSVKNTGGELTSELGVRPTVNAHEVRWRP